jgi:hypothetical protein
METSYRTLTPLPGLGAAGLFLLALLASGFSSSIVRCHCRPSDHAGFCILLYPALAPPSRRDGTFVRRRCRGHGHHSRPRAEPGGFEPRFANSDGGACQVHGPSLCDGRLRKYSPDKRAGNRRD